MPRTITCTRRILRGGPDAFRAWPGHSCCGWPWNVGQVAATMERVTLTGARGRPGRTDIVGERVRLEPLDPDRHAASLFAAQEGDPALWNYLPYGPFSRDAFVEHLHAQAASEDPLFFALVVDDAAVGVASMMRIDVAN